MTRRQGCLASVLIIIIATSLSVISSYSYSAREYQHIVVDDRSRSFILRLPSNYTEEGEYPLVIGIHGAGNNAKIFEQRTGLTQLAERDGFIICYPNGNGRIEYEILSWNSAHCCGYAFDQQIDDVKFIMRLIDHLKSQYSIDSSRVYLTGMSNGAILIHQIAAEFTETFAAIAPVAGTIGGYAYDGANLSSPVHPTGRVPVLMIHGSQDTHVAYTGGHAVLATGTRQDLSFDESATFWIDNNNCTLPPSTTLLYNDQVERVRYNAESNMEVLLFTIFGGIHIWPGEETDPLKAMDASSVIWSFFTNHSQSHE